MPPNVSPFDATHCSDREALSKSNSDGREHIMTDCDWKPSPLHSDVMSHAGATRKNEAGATVL